jgi:hypothetical protein
MSDESHPQGRSQARMLRDDEKALLMALLSTHPDFRRFEMTIATGKVSDMLDGSMGSVRFVAPDERSLGVTLVEADYVDSDGVHVSIAINTDDHGELYEVDFWKTDFSPLKQYPRPELAKICDEDGRHPTSPSG